MAEKFYIKNIDGCHNLVNGVVIQAGKDYESALKVLLKKEKPNMTASQKEYWRKKKAKAQQLLDAAVNFFHSEDYSAFTDIDADVLLYAIRRRVERKYK